ncbi:MAG: hypothetical protein NT002_13235 [candidate division Zixibacteria bacterium]|nr:hypothetical protein [candidate division Zixibacteria bacterium]
MSHWKSKIGIIRSIFAFFILLTVVGSIFTVSAWGEDPSGTAPLPPQQVPPIGNDSLSTPIKSVVVPEVPTVVDIIVLIIGTIL